MALSKKFETALLCSALALANTGCRDARSPPPFVASDVAIADAPVACTHSHNDYEQEWPLRGALRYGFSSVEADVFLVRGKLLVAHTVFELSDERTLDSLYLDPLQELARRNGGHIYPGSDKSIMLLVDVKSDAADTYAALRDDLNRHRGLFTAFSGTERREGAVTVVISGNEPERAQLEADTIRHAALDGRPEDLKKKFSAALMPLISADWADEFSWRGDGPMPPGQKAKLVGLVGAAHAQGKKSRFWGAPDSTAVWAAQAAADVDYINTDNLRELSEWVQEKKTPAKKRLALQALRTP